STIPHRRKSLRQRERIARQQGIIAPRKHHLAKSQPRTVRKIRALIADLNDRHMTPAERLGKDACWTTDPAQAIAKGRAQLLGFSQPVVRKPGRPSPQSKTAA